MEYVCSKLWCNWLSDNWKLVYLALAIQASNKYYTCIHLIKIEKLTRKATNIFSRGVQKGQNRKDRTGRDL